MNSNLKQGFWKTKSLSEMSQDEWESLCDGCGRCCLHKLEDDDDGVIYYTNVACHLLDLKTCRCKRYPDRISLVSDCICLTPANRKSFYWLPPTCTYRLLDEGKELPEWHPLLSNNKESIHTSGISVRDFAIEETEGLDLEEYVIELPEQVLPESDLTDID